MTPDPFAAVLGELAEEHGRAVAVHGFDAEHDARHSDADWAWRLLRRVSEVLAPETIVPSTPAERRRAFVELAHIAASAVAAHDLRQQRATPPPDLPHDGGGVEVSALGLVTSTDGSWRYVARPSTPDTIERHTLDCTAYRPRWIDGRALDLCPGDGGCWSPSTGSDPDDHEEPPTP